MELDKLNCPGCGGPVKVPGNKTPFNCEHCGSALVIREEAGVSLLELSDKLASIIEGGNQEIISVIQKSSRASTDARLYQSQIEQELSALSVQLVPLKAEFGTLSSAKKEANVVRRLQTISIQIYMLLERTRLLKHKLYETHESQKSPLDQLYEQYTYIQGEFAYLSHAGDSPDVRQFKANLSAQHKDVERQMVEIIRGALGSSSLSHSPENDIQVLLNQRRIVQDDIRTVSALAVTSATQKILLDLRAKERELNTLILRIQTESRRTEVQKQRETKLAGLQMKKDEILKQRQLTGWESISFFVGEQSIRHLGLLIDSAPLKFILGILTWFFLSMILVSVGIPAAFITSILLVLVLFNVNRIRRFFTGKLRQSKAYRDRNQTSEDSVVAAKLEEEKEEGSNLDESEAGTEPSVETSVNSESSTDVNIKPSLANVEVLPLLEPEPIENATSAELREKVTASYETSAELEMLNETDKKQVVSEISDSPRLKAEESKRKLPPKKLALIIVTILALAISGFCGLAGLVLASQSTLAGISAFFFGLFCLGLAALAVANLNATSLSSNGKISEKNILYTLYSNQKPIGLLIVLGLMFTCISTFVTIPTTGPTAAKAAGATPLDVSSLQTSALETAMMGIYQTATANPTITAIPTDTQVPSTATYTPSPIPSSTMLPSATPDVYEISIRERVPAYTEAFLKVLTYHQEVADDTALLFDTNWKLKQGFALGELERRADEMAALQPTPDYLTLHSIIIQLTNETHLFADAYTHGVDQLDADQIYQATLHMENMNALMEQATEEMKIIRSSP